MKIYNPFRRKKKNKKTVCLIKFVLYDSDDIQIQCDWDSNAHHSEEKCGELLEYITTGKLNGEILEILVNHGNKNPTDQDSINTILGRWVVNLAKDNNIPIVKPSQALSTKKE